MGSHILVVDDDTRILNLESLRLRRLGHTVTACETADGALERMRHTPDEVDLIITDYKMPGMDGLQLVRELQDGALPAVPIVMMTGYREEVTADEVYNVGVDVLLTKPVEQGELEDALSTLL
jgi:CheY-like chemotaxis protein